MKYLKRFNESLLNDIRSKTDKSLSDIHNKLGISKDNKFCAQCGTKLDKNDSFCGECGTEQEQQNFEGKLVLKLEGVGSKSEGVRAYLETKDGKYKLYRKGTYAIGDPYFKQFENKNVIVFGELQKGTFIMVEKIEIK
jgi:hypothetical protein